MSDHRNQSLNYILKLENIFVLFQYKNLHFLQVKILTLNFFLNNSRLKKIITTNDYVD